MSERQSDRCLCINLKNEIIWVIMSIVSFGCFVVCSTRSKTSNISDDKLTPRNDVSNCFRLAFQCVCGAKYYSLKLYHVQSQQLIHTMWKAIRIGSVLETTTFSSQSATILVASLLLYIVFFDLNRFSSIPSSSMFSWLPVFFIFYSCSSVYFTFSIIAVPLL